MDLIIYHNNCPDGWCAAFICKMKYQEAELMGMDHGPDPSVVEALIYYATGKDVIMVDYSLRTRELNDRLNAVTKSFRILDHHKTAKAALEGATYATFDMKCSGAGLAWDYLFGKFSGELCDICDHNMPDGKHSGHRPWWVNYTEDQDLWRWSLPQSPEINAFLMTQLRDMETWIKITNMRQTDALMKGAGARSYIEYYTRSVTAEAQEGILLFEGRNHRAAVINIPYVGVSEAGAALVESGYDIALAWFERGDGIVQFSLRSKKGGEIDVSAIAKRWGGGGHQSAAGFQLDLTTGRKLVDRVLGRFNE